MSSTPSACIADPAAVLVDGSWTAKKTVAALLSRWSEHGFPDYVRFGNDTIALGGAHQWPDCFGRATRTSLRLEMMVVFAPLCKADFQAATQADNGC